MKNPEKTLSRHKNVIISSTARDLPDHRKEVMDACLRQGMFPVMMEHLPASDEEAISASLKMVDAADIYVGVFAHRYGYVPNEHVISLTEMEYNRAVERKIPRLVFMMDKEHLLRIEDVEIGENAVKLDAFKKRLLIENIVNFFKSPADLRAHVINSLSQYREADLAAFHYISDIPTPPEAYIAHPYTLLQTHQLVGRQAELNLLTDWVTKRHEQIYWVRILNIVAIGGMGKSALTWKWFNDIVPQEMQPLAGRMWWSFYESDASFENFVIRALTYVTQLPRQEVQKLSLPDREAQLLATLNKRPFLLVLDGLERILIAYARMDAAHLADDDLDQQTANFVAGVVSPTVSATPSFVGQHRLCRTADPLAGNFLRKLANVRASRILVSTRLYPADLQTVAGNPIPGSYAVFLRGLTDDDALNLWRAFGVSGSRKATLSLLHLFDNHPLLIQALAGEVAQYHPAPGNFDRWRKDHPAFNPFSLQLASVKSHVLGFAFRGLSASYQRILQTVAAFRMPTTYDTLTALLVGQDKLLPDERILDAGLTELEDRGLMGWDRCANRYDLHPVVRSMVWSGLSDKSKRSVYMNLYAHFAWSPTIDESQVNSFEDLAPAVELYNTLIGLGRYDDALAVFRDRLAAHTLYRLSASRQSVELLEMLFPDGLDQLPRLRKPRDQAFTVNELAAAYDSSGQPECAAALFRKSIAIDTRESDLGNMSTSLNNLSGVLYCCGALAESEAVVRRALVISRQRNDHFQEAVSLAWFGLILAVRGALKESESALQRSLRIFIAWPESLRQQCAVNAFLAQRAFWLNDPAGVWSLADHSQELARVAPNERGFIRATRLQGAAALGMNDLAKAEECLHCALTRARAVTLVDEELGALVALAELRQRQGNLQTARELLDDMWEFAERGPYPLFHADAYNILAKIERDAGNHAAAVEAATKAYCLAWCNGEPFSYCWGLETAQKHLKELRATEPQMPPFDGNTYEPMPEVEIDPDDDFHARKLADN
jgi:tetratricopeptide (TPR) repeat protein